MANTAQRAFENRYFEMLDRFVQAPGEDVVAIVEKIAVGGQLPVHAAA
jgi:type IV secretory pathway protease TraF